MPKINNEKINKKKEGNNKKRKKEREKVKKNSTKSNKREKEVSISRQEKCNFVSMQGSELRL